MNCIDAHGLKIAPVLFDFIAKEAAPRPGLRRTRSGRDSPPSSTISPRKTANCSRRATRCKQRSTTGIAPTRASRSTSPPIPRSSRRSATCCRSRATHEIATADVDDEIGKICGPQLVVPLTNARYALNAANARWGSLYDALYGTDAIPHEPGEAAARATTRPAATRSSPRRKPSSTPPRRWRPAATPTSPPTAIDCRPAGGRN